VCVRYNTVVADPVVWFNPSCSKCRTTQSILADRGVDAEYVHYLTNTPPRAELERVLEMLGTSDPRAIARTGEPAWSELGLDAADRDRVLDALIENPALIERPIVILGDRAVIARPPEKVLELLDGAGGGTAAPAS
jgi:arsenate reductase (glutaredoxin)